MITNLWGVIDTKMATDAAAHEGARLVAEADGPGDRTLGISAAQASLAAHGRDNPGDLTYAVEIPGGWAPCARATVTVEYQLALISLPMVGLSTGPKIPVTSTHSEIVDPYRSRATDPGDGGCGPG